ncbi:alpha/beta fold hydrolase [Francisella sp. 19X1-34]|uniref:alpha/beta fold hydrolase n=1 Tax=Francisella sp. 19X1-34 TaxID=3087177 RepID=UPI002E3572F2|nr:alpha/beta fold hydrolase [Francisella sp. 19X1-34]MED7789606.1 alpha/beta fold hydrolase [Francisella sp. 19X1-34]
MYKKLQLKNSEINYLDSGEGFPILFGHSFLWTNKMWQPQIESLSKSYRCIVPDLWGHGDSGSVPEDTESLGDLANEMLSLLDHLGIQKFGIVGLSVGGMWAVEMALKVPERVKFMVLMDTFMGIEPEKSKNEYFGMLDLIGKMGTIPEPIITQVAPNFFSKSTQQTKPTLVTEFSNNLSSELKAL